MKLATAQFVVYCPVIDPDETQHVRFYEYLCTGQAIRHSCACVYVLRAGNTRYNCSNETSFEVSLFFSVFFFSFLSTSLRWSIQCDQRRPSRRGRVSPVLLPHVVTPFLLKGCGWRLVPAQLPNRYTTGCAYGFVVEAIAHHGTAMSVWTFSGVGGRSGEQSQ